MASPVIAHAPTASLLFPCHYASHAPSPPITTTSTTSYSTTTTSRTPLLHQTRSHFNSHPSTPPPEFPVLDHLRPQSPPSPAPLIRSQRHCIIRCQPSSTIKASSRPPRASIATIANWSQLNLPLLIANSYATQSAHPRTTVAVRKHLNDGMIEPREPMQPFVLLLLCAPLGKLVM